ncbi:hypothetical protein RRG08_054078 [Elysia crispata]|uniref:Uncharacterized protein n=1 Tax=Elysia crispata TaxID=231223 RepID=A0AAE0ZD13_9GAST|nr:hypothetical protein RRG08_054078 [Elysia crispata]
MIDNIRLGQSPPARLVREFETGHLVAVSKQCLRNDDVLVRSFAALSVFEKYVSSIIKLGEDSALGNTEACPELVSTGRGRGEGRESTGDREQLARFIWWDESFLLPPCNEAEIPRIVYFETSLTADSLRLKQAPSEMLGLDERLTSAAIDVALSILKMMQKNGTHPNYL